MTAEEILQRGVSAEVFPGGVVGFCSPTEQHFWCTGRLEYSSGSPLVTQHTVYDVASITKTIPTACVVWKLIEEGRLSLQDQVQSYLPEWRGKYKDQVLLWHLLAQVVRYENISLSSLTHLSREELVKKILQLEIIEPPESSYYYVNASSILLTWIVEKVSGESLDALAQRYFWKPLKMKETSFLAASLRSEIAPTERDPRTKQILRGIVHDESARVLSEAGSVVGSAGLFSSAEDILSFLQRLLQNDGTLFSDETLRRMFAPKTLANGQLVGLGWELNAPWMGKLQENCFGKTGFTGCCVALFPEKRRALVFLSNAVHPQRPESKEVLTTLRSQLTETLPSFAFSQNS